MASINVAIVGTGFQAQYHAAAYAKLPEVELVACCDLVEDARNAFGRRFGCTPYASLTEMLQQRRDLDAISVVTPGALHYSNVMEILASPTPPKAILCEKPPALSIAEIEQMGSTAAAAGVTLAFAFFLAQDPSLRWLCANSDELLGPVYRASIIWRRSGGIPARPSLLAASAVGGAVLDLLGHLVTPLLMLLEAAKPAWVVANLYHAIGAQGGTEGKLNPALIQVEDAGDGRFLVLHAAGACLANFVIEWDAYIPHDMLSIEFEGDKGGATLELDHASSSLVPQLYRVVKVDGMALRLVTTLTQPAVTLDGLHDVEIAQLVRAVTTGQGVPHLVNAELAANVMRIVLGAYESDKLGDTRLL